MDFVCRFRMTKAVPTKHSELVRDDQGEYVKDENGHYTYSYHPGVMVEFQGVQGEPFGKYTPNASAQLTILNPAVASYLSQVWTGYTTDSTADKAPEFEVIFREVHDATTSPETGR